jgi:hypothetical protein
MTRIARTAEQIEADGASPRSAAQQAQVEAWLASHEGKTIEEAIAADEIDAGAADGFMTATRQRAASVKTDGRSLSERFVDAMKQDAWDRAKQERAERSRLNVLIHGLESRHGLGEIVKLGDDYVVEVRDGGRTYDSLWTTVVNGEKTFHHHATQEAAILHLIARRHDSNPNTSACAAFYAGRILGLPETNA